LRKIEKIVREEMDRAGALEVLMPALQPPDIWQKSGRYEAAQDVFFKAKDRAQKEWILGPTHEEVITTLVAGEIASYKQLPKNFYQIQTKFRDEIRPRFGLMRAKEFIMKDAYSFDVSDEAAQRSYHKMYDAYIRVFRRCGLKALPVEADTGVMGGKFSHEFMAPSEIGEDSMAYVDSGEYAANLEKATSALKSPADSGETVDIASLPAIEKFATPGVKTIEALTKEPYGVAASSQIKTLVFIADEKPVIFLVRGCDELNEAKLAGVIATTAFRAAEPKEINDALGAYPGSLGPVAVNADIPVYADLLLKGAHGMTTGANENKFHIRNVSMERDVAVTQWADLRTVHAGEPCPATGQPLKIQRVIEVGHVFKLGSKYAEALDARFLDKNGKLTPAVMGSYGIGVTRTLQAVIEQNHDENGIIWPIAIAPFQVCLTPLNVDPESEVMKLAEKLYEELTAKGADVILDDRDLRPGFKFKDSELTGLPIRVGIGEKSLAKGVVELKRRGGELETVPPGEAVAAVMAIIEEG
jgi:prolyl-tRNA synthetase